MPGKSLVSAAENDKGVKRSKDRITGFVLCNVTGTDKFRLTVIGKYVKFFPRISYHFINAFCFF